MDITYIEHSGFLIELNSCYIIFDYYRGTVPDLGDKPVYVFSSHSHKDHFNPAIFEILKDKKAKFILSYDIKKKAGESENIIYVKANKEYTVDDIYIRTLRSTDMGVAFIVKSEDKTIFHSGDLNDWRWAEETKAYNNNMEKNFRTEIDKLKGITLDVAFIPLDPRQENYYFEGMSYILNTINVKYAFPMHFWHYYEIIDRFIEEGHNRSDCKIIRINNKNEKWRI